MFLWIIGVVWSFNRKGVVTTERDDTNLPAYDSADEAVEGDANYGEEPVSEIVLQGSQEDEARERAARDRAAAEAEADTDTDTPESTTGEEEVDEGPPTYPVWFESQRDIGVCKVRWDSGGKTANLHVEARVPEGRLRFSYTCGSSSGRGSINVKPNRVNGVLFCKEPGSVSVKTVRSKDGRCGR